MKVVFEFSADKNGMPLIKFRHHDKDGSLDQIMLGHFIKMAQDHGLEIVNPSGYINSEHQSWEEYQIIINPAK